MKVLESEIIDVDLRHKVIGQENRVLDIGGGGEGIISQLYGRQVVAIDIREDELAEISETKSLKLVMDASKLTFIDNQFDLVTAFFSFMYLGDSELQDVISEVYRVLKPGGRFEIWDVNLPSIDNVDEDVFIAQLRVSIPHKTITTGYGVGLGSKRRDSDLYLEMIEFAGLKVIESEVYKQGNLYIGGLKDEI